MSVIEFQFQWWDQIDIDAFNGACGTNVNVDAQIGSNNQNYCSGHQACVESLLDIEYIGAVAAPIPLTVQYQQQFSLSDWMDSVLAEDSPALVHSASYGNDEVQQTSTEYMDTVNQKFAMAGTRGLSIIFASGDQGVWGRSGVGATYNPDFPGASPYITTVGGTDFVTKGVVGDETTWDCGGGGFSDHFDIPEYQADAVAGYLADAQAAGVLPPSNLFTSTGRAYPDIAALAGQQSSYCISVGGGNFMSVAGTSAACPVVAGIVAQLNNERLSNGGAPLGFLNPWIYSVAGPAGCFNDVADGSQNNCNKGTQGFSAIKGWDAATGFGTPIYSCMSKNL
jgi:tripeptidyl-peptidase-1